MPAARRWAGPLGKGRPELAKGSRRANIPRVNAQASPVPLPHVAEADFLAEARGLSSLPPEGLPEVALAGRSNVGKSTLLNALAQRKGLARISRTPGRTRGLVFFRLRLTRPEPQELAVVDFPGYGYAKVSKSERRAWQTLVEGYTQGRQSLRLFLVLVDARRGLQEEEEQLLEWLRATSVRHRLIFTKVDKLTAGERGLLKSHHRGALHVAAAEGKGLDQVWKVVLSALRPPDSDDPAEGQTPAG